MIIRLVMEGKILIVDDEQAIRKLTAILITSLGRTVVEADNGLAALDIISENEISLIILDHNMPVMDGMTLLGKVQELGLEIPVLMMSGAQDTALRQSCYELGVYDFIEKPERPEILKARVENGLKIAELLEYRRATGRDLRVSAAIMRKLAAPPLVQAKGHSLRTLMKSYAEVGGDLCMAFGAETEKPVFAIADITGHGVSAALFSVLVSVAMRRAYREVLVPHKILTRLNRELAEHLPASYFVTMFCWAYDAARGEITCANAGHPPPFIRTSGDVQQFRRAESPALGINAHEDYQPQVAAFTPGDWLLAYTDGVLDVFSGPTYTPDGTLEEFARKNYDALPLYEHLETYLEHQSDFIDDRSVMLFSI